MNDTWNNSIQIGSKIIDFRIEYSNRKTLGITVTPEMNVLVKAPVNASIEKVKEKIKRKAPCIIKQQSFFHSFQPKIPQRKYVSGETYLSCSVEALSYHILSSPLSAILVSTSAPAFTASL